MQYGVAMRWEMVVPGKYGRETLMSAKLGVKKAEAIPDI